MSREYKFRVWDKITNRYLQELGIYNWHIPYSLDGEEITGEASLFGLSELLRSDNFVAQQHTGLTDKNKKEIYEGDILDFTARYKQTGPVEVIYYGASFGCVVTDDGGLKEFWDLSHIVQQHYPEIIGNISENPELLK
jgi:uncharacterized phage protein (TIGR01671 family)